MNHSFEADGLRIAFDDIGSGEPILLLHGFGADKRLNWRLTGWYDTLTHAGYRVIAPDARGHGHSDKPADPAAYRPEGIAGDAIRLLDHLKIAKAHVFGYSMGGRNAAWLLIRHQQRLLSAIIGGQGLNLLRSEDPERWTSRGFRLTADNSRHESLAIPAFTKLYGYAARSGGRLGAFAACLLGAFPHLHEKDFARVRIPVLVVCAAKDTLAGSPIPLAEAIPGARAVVVPGRGHVSVLTDPFFKGAVLGFLGHRWERPRRQRRKRRA